MVLYEQWHRALIDLILRTLSSRAELVCKRSVKGGWQLLKQHCDIDR